MASPAPGGAAAGHGPGGSGGAEETLDFAAGRKRQPPLAAQSAFSFIPTSRQGPPELSYFSRKAKVREGRGRARESSRAQRGKGQGSPVGFPALANNIVLSLGARAQPSS